VAILNKNITRENEMKELYAVYYNGKVVGNQLASFAGHAAYMVAKKTGLNEKKLVATLFCDSEENHNKTIQKSLTI
jgi:hypothetical protein